MGQRQVVEDHVCLAKEHELGSECKCVESGAGLMISK